ncbi:MAG: hypothetical protein BIFFINMI_00057 [Phycisphaerae bacterium]|nr:hypothetical protein [Phycisphaerae bacterium]
MAAFRRSVGWRRWVMPACVVAIAGAVPLAAWIGSPPSARADGGTAVQAAPAGATAEDVSFVKLNVQKLGDQQLTFLVGKPLHGTRTGEAQFLIDPSNASWTLAHALKAGDQVKVIWQMEHGIRMVVSVELVAPAAPPKPDLARMTPAQLRAHAEKLTGDNDKLTARVAELEAQVVELKKRLGEPVEAPKAPAEPTLPPTTDTSKTPGSTTQAPADANQAKAESIAAPLPEGAAGFRGFLIGPVQSIDGQVFTMKVAKIGGISSTSKAGKAQVLVGTTVTLYIPASGEHVNGDGIKALKVGESAVSGAVNESGNAFKVYFFLGNGDRVPGFG